MTTIIRPVICYCSGNQTHKTPHIECRCDGQQRLNDAQSEFLRIYNAKGDLKQVLWPKRILPIPARDSDGYSLCSYCGLIEFKSWLVQCPYCDKYFKGPTFWYNKKFHYECEECG